MNILKIRFYLFIFGCILSRLFITLLSSFAYGKILRAIGFLALIPVLGWLYIIFIGKRDTGLEVFGDKIWWNNLRPIHLGLWSLFAYLAINGNRRSWIVLLVDTLFGLFAFLLHHYSAGNLPKMIY